MDTIVKKSGTLYELNDEFACRSFARVLEKKFNSYKKLSLADIDDAAKSFFTNGYSTEVSEKSWRDYVREYTSDDVKIKIWSKDYATLTIKKGAEKRKPTLEDFKNDLCILLNELYNKYEDSDVLNETLDHAVVAFRVIDLDEMHVSDLWIYKEVEE